MPCLSPIPAWRGALNPETGKRSIVFNRRQHQVGEEMLLPCGKCVECRYKERLTWALRMQCEASLYKQNCMVTLTYADDAQKELDKTHIQKFFRDLRYRTSGAVRYFYCGEYGDQSGRPHYHAMIFGHDYRGGSSKIGERSYVNPFVSAIWNRGHVQLDEFTMAGACYVAGYVAKKKSQEVLTDMSRRPGIGHDWLMRYREGALRLKTIQVNGQSYPLPTRFLEWLGDDAEPLKTERRKIAKATPILTPNQKNARYFNRAPSFNSEKI